MTELGKSFSKNKDAPVRENQEKDIATSNEPFSRRGKGGLFEHSRRSRSQIPGIFNLDVNNHP